MNLLFYNVVKQRLTKIIKIENWATGFPLLDNNSISRLNTKHKLPFY